MQDLQIKSLHDLQIYVASLAFNNVCAVLRFLFLFLLQWLWLQHVPENLHVDLFKNVHIFCFLFLLFCTFFVLHYRSIFYYNTTLILLVHTMYRYSVCTIQYIVAYIYSTVQYTLCTYRYVCMYFVYTIHKILNIYTVYM